MSRSPPASRRPASMGRRLQPVRHNRPAGCTRCRRQSRSAPPEPADGVEVSPRRGRSRARPEGWYRHASAEAARGPRTSMPRRPRSAKPAANDHRDLRDRDQQPRTRREPAQHRLRHQVHDLATSDHADADANHADQQGQETGQKDLLRARGRCERAERTPDENRCDRRGAGLQVRRRREERGRDRRQRRRVQPDVRW